jgi:hypothetical protein
MKQMIILLAMIILGLAIASMIMGFKGTSQAITDSTTSKIEEQFPTTETGGRQ